MARTSSWVADPTTIAILGGFVYLAAVMDAWSRRIVGYALGRRIDARLTLAALTTAIESGKRALRGIALGRKSWLFAGSDRGGERAAAMDTLIGTAKLNDVAPQAWLTDVLDRIADLPLTRLHELLPWHWKARRQQALAA